MNKTEYIEYEKAVEHFFESEGISSFSTGSMCTECGGDFNEEGICDCGGDRDSQSEGFFSWRRCECCGSSLGGTRYDVFAYHKESGEILQYEVCGDCLYYEAYGQLDDQTMLDMGE